MHCGNVSRWYNYTFVAFPCGAAINLCVRRSSDSGRLLWNWIPFLSRGQWVFFLLVIRLAEQVFRSKHFHTFTDLCSASRGTLLCCHIGALLGVLNENVAGKIEALLFLQLMSRMKKTCPNRHHSELTSPQSTNQDRNFIFLWLMVQPYRWVTETLTDPGKLQTACS